MSKIEKPDNATQDSETTSEEMWSVLDRIGPHQRRLFFLIIFPLIIDGYQTMSVVVTFASPLHRCQVPGLTNDTFSIQNEAHRMLVNLSIPMTSSGADVGYSECDVYKDRDERHANRTVYDDTEPCNSWVYDVTDFDETVVTQFDLVCEKKGFRANFNMINMVGILVGCLVTGVLCDRFGRKRVLMVSMSLTIVLLTAAAFPVLTPVLLVYRFLTAALGAGIYLALYVLSLEFMGAEHRAVAGTLMMVLWVLGPLTVGVLSFAVRDWRWLQVLNGAPFVLCLSYWWLLDESPRWLLAEGRAQEAQKVILKVMKVNNITMPTSNPLGADALRMKTVNHQHNTATAVEDSDRLDTHRENIAMTADVDKERRNAETEKDREVQTCKEHTKDPDADRGNRDETEKEGETPQETILKICKFPNLVARTAVLFFNWAAISTGYFGLSLNVGNLGGDVRLNFLLSSLVEALGYGIAWFLLDRLGRKRTHCAAMLLSGTSCLATIFSVMYGGSDLQWVTVLLVMVGKLGISAAFSTVYLLTGELFPTVIRNQGLGCSSTVGGLATTLAPYVSDLSLHIEGSVGRAVPLVIFGSLALAAGLLALCLPETLHRTLPDTILQAASFTREQSPDAVHVRQMMT